MSGVGYNKEVIEGRHPLPAHHMRANYIPQLANTYPSFQGGSQGVLQNGKALKDY